MFDKIRVDAEKGFPTPSATIQQFDLYEFELWRAKHKESDEK